MCSRMDKLQIDKSFVRILLYRKENYFKSVKESSSRHLRDYNLLHAQFSYYVTLAQARHLYQLPRAVCAITTPSPSRSAFTAPLNSIHDAVNYAYRFELKFSMSRLIIVF